MNHYYILINHSTKKEKDLSEKEYSCITSLRPDNVCHHMNKDFIQISLALRKAVTSHMNEKIRYFFLCVFDIASQLLTRHSPFAPLGQVDEWTAKPSRFSIQGNLSELSRIMPAKNIKKAVPRKDNDVQTFLEGEENKYTKRTESYVFSDFGNGVSRGWERKLTTGRFAIGRFCPFT